MHACCPERLVDETFLRGMSAARWLVDDVLSMQELLDGQRVVYLGVILSHHPDVTLLKQYLTADGTVEVLKVAHGEIDIPGLQSDAAHASRWHLDGLNVDHGRFFGNDCQQ